MSKFQLVLLIVFGLFIIVGVLIFATARGGASRVNINVSVWGSVDPSDFSKILYESGLDQNQSLDVLYTEIPEEKFNETFTEALATGKGPDLVIIPHDKLWENKEKLLVIPEESLSRADYMSVFNESSEIFLGKEGAYVIPFYSDPLVLYYNRDLLSKAGLAKPPAYWDEMYTYAEALTKRDGAGNITESAIALGESRNIKNSKEILSTLLLGAGSPVMYENMDLLRPSLLENNGQSFTPGEAALDFYTQFSNPLKPFYSWNRALLPSETMFLSGDLAMYIGYGSEIESFRSKNPNLNFAIAKMPQSRVSQKAVTFGRIYGLGISRAAEDPNGALQAAILLTSRDTSKVFSSILGYPPVRRELLSEKQNDPFMAVLYESSLISKGWLDPDDTKSRTVFSKMIDEVTSGRLRTMEALRTASNELEALAE